MVKDHDKPWACMKCGTVDMDNKERFAKASEALERMVFDYRADMARWEANNRPELAKHVDAATIAKANLELVREQPLLSAWLLAVALQRLGDQT
jgi:hypothetical protein